MGENKALLLVDGIPLWRRQWNLLHDVGVERPLLSLRERESWAPSDVAWVRDDGSAGPLGGIFAAFDCSPASHLVVVAVDLPRLPAAWLSRLLSRCGFEAGAVGWRAGLNAFEPLAAIYPRRILPLVRSALESRRFSLQPLLKRAVADGLLVAVPIQPPEEDWFLNWNVPGDVTDS